MTDIVQIQESEYDAILRQAVAVIDKTRAMVATTVCSAIGTAHWEIGKLLHDKLSRKKTYSNTVPMGGCFENLYIGCEKFPQADISPVAVDTGGIM